MSKRGKEHEQEIVLKITRKAFIPMYALATILLLTPVILAFLGYKISIWLWITVFIILTIGIKMPEIERFMTTYYITPTAIIVEKGFVSKRRIYKPLSTVMDVDLEQTAWQRLLNYGDLTIKTFQGDVNIGNIDNPRRIIPLIEKHVAEGSTLIERRKEALTND